MRKRTAGSVGYERRTYPIELRVDGEGDTATITGHAAVFNELSEEMGIPGWFSFREKLAPDCFTEAVKRVNEGQDDVYALLNHDENFIVAGSRVRSGPGSLTLKIDGRGLDHTSVPLDTPPVRDYVLAPMRAGLLRKMSFGFQVDSEHDEIRDQQTVRVIDKVLRLFDVSYVTYPAYPQTDVQARSLFKALKIDPSKLTTREQIAVRSFMDTLGPRIPFLRREADPNAWADGGCDRDACGHAAAMHLDGEGACTQNDGCDSYLAPDSPNDPNDVPANEGLVRSSRTTVTAASVQADRARSGAPELTGVSADMLRRQLDLHVREFNAGEPLN